MTLLFRDVTFLNFDQTYVPQKRLRQFPHEWIDFQDLRQVKRYCEADSFRKIKHRLKRRSNHGITFIGSGDYHYITYLLLSEIGEKFSLLLFDHHADMMTDPSPSIISCGSWASRAVANLPQLQKVIVIGVRPDSFGRTGYWQSKITVFPESSFEDSSHFAARVLSAIETDTVYISIDKDVLDPTQARTNWDQGSLKLPVLLELLGRVVSLKKVYGVDICGEYPVSPTEFFRPDCAHAVQKNEQANRKILQALRQEHDKIA